MATYNLLLNHYKTTRFGSFRPFEYFGGSCRTLVFSIRFGPNSEWMQRHHLCQNRFPPLLTEGPILSHPFSHCTEIREIFPFANASHVRLGLIPWVGIARNRFLSMILCKQCRNRLLFKGITMQWFLSKIWDGMGNCDFLHLISLKLVNYDLIYHFKRWELVLPNECLFKIPLDK